MVYITLITEDGVPFKINIKLAKIFNLFKDILEVFERTEEYKNEALPLKGINSRIFTKCVEWTIYHKDDPLYQESDPPCTGATEWDKEFFEMMNNNDLCMFINAAAYLDASKMIDQACEAFAEKVKKTMDQNETEGSLDRNILKSMFGMTDPNGQSNVQPKPDQPADENFTAGFDGSIVQGTNKRRKCGIMDPLAKRRRLC